MPNLFRCEPCTNCGYLPKSDEMDSEVYLPQGGGMAGIVKIIVVCRDCREITISHPDYVTFKGLNPEFSWSETDYLKPFSVLNIDLGVCILCKSTNLRILSWLNGEWDAENWVDCPRCEVGKVCLVASGFWD